MRDPFAEHELARLRQVLDALPVAVSIYSPRGTVLLVNRARLAMVGDAATLDDAAARTEPRDPDGTPIPQARLPGRRALAGEIVADQRMRLRRPGGTDIVVLANASPIRDDSGAVVAAVLVLNDITALSELERGRRDLFAMANHDLRTPLTTILASVELARKQIQKPASLEVTLARVEREGERMFRLIRDLLDVARFETGEIPVEPRDDDVVERVRAAVARQASDGRLETRVPPGAVHARIDRDRIDQILDNLIANALRHTMPDTTVVVAVSVEGSEVLVRVTDRGRGVAPEERARLFAPFYQTPRGRTYGGTGLGLHISRRIAEAHGGRLFLEESGPSGSTFTLALPLVVSEPPRS